MADMWDSKQLDALAAVASQGSFEQAAEKLGLTASAVSQRIRALEEETGFPLVTRTRPCRPTVQGQKLLRYIRSLEWLERETRNELEQAGRPYIWPIATNHDSLESWLLPALAKVAETENLLPDIQADNEEHTHKWMNEGRVMAAVSTRAQALAGCEVHLLGYLEYRLMAAPSLVAHYFADGVQKSSLKRAPLLVFDRKDNMQTEFLRLYFGLNAERCPTVYIPASAPFYQAARLGLGYGMIPDGQGAASLAEGKMVDLCPGKSMRQNLYWHCWPAASPRLAALNQKLVAAARSLLQQP